MIILYQLQVYSNYRQLVTGVKMLKRLLHMMYTLLG